MPKGIKQPVKISTTGGLNTIEGSEILRQNIIQACRPASSENPWSQNITPQEDMIFDIADELGNGKYISHVYQVFEEYERLGMAKLPSSNALRIVRNKDGETEVHLRYIDLEDSQERLLLLRGV
jgi:hypothetical protein